MGALMVKRVLMIAYHYPPVRGSSGVQRTLKFTRYLGDHDWEPIVLTVHPMAYPQVGCDQMREIPEHITVKRVFALDAARHLSIKGAYPEFLAWPDRWASWWLGAVPVGLNLIRALKPAAIWSTFPIATAHLVSLTLARLTRLPWVADFRDPMREDHYPPGPRQRYLYRGIERCTVSRARRVVFTTAGTARMYAERYPHVPSSRWQTIANGYDEENFAAAQAATKRGDASTGGPIKLVHSGLLYPSERDPKAFFDALSHLKVANEISCENLKITLRATGHDDLYRGMLEAHEIQDIVSLQPSVPYEQALAEMLSADGLLILQGSSCNHQIPAKLYEYLRARRPILALTDSRGDTASVLNHCGIDTIASLADTREISTVLARFLTLIRVGRAPIARDEIIANYSRRAQSAELARLLNSLCLDANHERDHHHETA